MFTGLVQCCGRVAAITPNPFGAVLAIDPRDWSHQPTPGESIAVNGCCLTAKPGPDHAPSISHIYFDVIRQTLDLTTLGDLAPGDPINLEHAVLPTTMLGGHIVQGHVDGVGEILDVSRDTSEWRVRIQPPGHLLDYIAPQGSIALDGVSLTVARLEEPWFEVALIPTTLELTNLSAAQADGRVNIEADYVAKTVVHWLRRQRNAPPVEG